MALVIGPFLGVLIAAFVASIMPKQYQSTAIIQETSQNALLSRSYFATAYIVPIAERISSKRNLLQVVKDNDLARSWNLEEKQAVQALQKKLEIHQRTGTDLFEI